MRNRTGLVVSIGALVVVGLCADASAQNKQAEDINAEGRRLFSQGELDAAVDKFRAAIKIDAQARYYFNLCFVLNAKGELDQAEQACKAVTTAAGTDERLRTRSANVLISIEKKRAKQKPNAPPPPPEPDPEPEPLPPEEPVTKPAEPPPPPARRVKAPPPPPQQPRYQPRPVRHRLHYGAKAGITFANQSSGDFSLDPRVGVAAGAFLSTSLARRLVVQGEVLYTQKGATEEDLDFELTIAYIEFPILAKYLFPIGRRLNLHGYAGGAVGFVVSATTNVDGDVSDATSSTEVSLIAGFGITVRTGGAAAYTVDVRYQQGLTDVSNDDSEVVNDVVYITGGYLF